MLPRKLLIPAVTPAHGTFFKKNTNRLFLPYTPNAFVCHSLTKIRYSNPALLANTRTSQLYNLEEQTYDSSTVEPAGQRRSLVTPVPTIVSFECYLGLGVEGG